MRQKPSLKADIRYQVFLYLLGVFKESELISLVTTNWFNQKVSKKPFNLQNTGGLPIVPEGFHFSFNILTSVFPMSLHQISLSQETADRC